MKEQLEKLNKEIEEINKEIEEIKSILRGFDVLHKGQKEINQDFIKLLKRIAHKNES